MKFFTLTLWIRNHSLKYEELKIYSLETCKKIEVDTNKDWNDTYFGEVECEKGCQTCMTADEVSTFYRIFKYIIILFNYGWSDFDTEYTSIFFFRFSCF